jgi:hypothetical protein
MAHDRPHDRCFVACLPSPLLSRSISICVHPLAPLCTPAPVAVSLALCSARAYAEGGKRGGYEQRRMLTCAGGCGWNRGMGMGPGMRGPDMRGPDMRGPDLRGPDLRGPDLRGPDMGPVGMGPGGMRDGPGGMGGGPGMGPPPGMGTLLVPLLLLPCSVDFRLNIYTRYIECREIN